MSLPPTLCNNLSVPVIGSPLCIISNPDMVIAQCKAWRDIWGAGQGVGSIDAVASVADVVARLRREYAAARERLAGEVA